ncbi:aryl-alcohol dehydrogenase-like predicted oxidoreductase [Geodermatophilus bullaregiensis]|uniref:aldo/keto reductase family oxidoreductase n=1 Tax=Geodermatophilus bullaregiensis TaxID=1564160 RepID=UPI001956E2E1|nr:aldo/keto reductase family oxidoreductase [Geodermatophilus bullaregiensis]MBM7807816.1 aryl-alcohol dehydrogenase-like predicted oxidoreductase [Geodermatophilus bullaregiensis]
MTTTTAERSGQFVLGDRTVNRIGYGAMRLSGPHIMGPPADREAAVAVLRRAVELGVDHVDTSDYYGPHVTNEIIREALHPYPEQLTIVTKVGARRTPDGEWPEALSPDELRSAVQDNLDHLGLDVLDVVNLRMPGVDAPVERSLAEPFGVLAELQQQGLIRHLGVSNVTTQQFAEARSIAPVVCVQNHYNLVHRDDDPMVDALAREGIAYVPFFPLGGFTPLQSAALETVARRLETTPMQVALAWLLARSPNLLLIPGTSSVAHLEENLQAAARVLGPAEMAELDRIGGTGEPDVDL